jgi:hypothetical protein
MPDDATVEILLKWKQENERVVADVQAQLAALTAQTTAAAAATTAANSAAASGWPVWASWAIGIAVAVAALSPFVALVGGAAVVLTAFAVAGASTLALLGGLALGFGAVGAAVVALGINAMGGTDPGATLEKATSALSKAQRALSDFDRIHSGGTGGASSAAARRLYDAQQAVKDFEALQAASPIPGSNRYVPGGQRGPGGPSPRQQLATAQQREDLLRRLTQAQDAYNASSGGGLSVAQQIEREKLMSKLTDAQNAYSAALVWGRGPMNTLREDLEAMFATWGKQAIPMTSTILLLADKLIPAVTQYGSEIIKWFGDRLPPVLDGISRVVRNLTPDFENFAKFLGGFFDRIGGLTSIGPGGTIVTLGGIFENFARLAMSAVQGLLGVFGQLSQWFLERLPVYGPIVQQTMGLIANAVLGVASVWGRFADWLVANWPQITDLASRAIKSISDNWALVAPQWNEFITKVGPKLWELLKLAADNAGALVPIVIGLVQFFTLLSMAVLAVVGGISMLITKMSELASLINNNPLLKALVLPLSLGSNITISGGGSGGSQPGPGNPTWGQNARASVNTTINVTGQSDPQATAAVVAGHMRRITAF